MVPRISPGISPDRLWHSPSPDPILSRDEVHVWRASLDQPATDRTRLAQFLSPDERERAERFCTERDRRRFIAGRGILRAILGQYLGMDPGRLQFGYGPRGKPHLAGKPAPDAISFNLSHSHELVLLAFTRGRRIGVDLEYQRPLDKAALVAARFFSAYENAILRQLPAGQRQAAFFRCWTCKEAYIKAMGDGFPHRLDRFDVSLNPAEPARLLRGEGGPEEASRWSLEAWTPAPGYAAALVVEGHGWDLTGWHYSASSSLRSTAPEAQEQER